LRDIYISLYERKLYLRERLGMDEMKLNLGSKFMRKMVSKLMSRYLSKQIGSKVTLDLNALNVRFDDGDTVIKTDLELRMDKHEFRRLMKKVDIDEF
jgi:hypothetical protein